MITTFFTPITFDRPTTTWGERLLQKADDYFYLGGKRAHVFKDGPVKVTTDTASWTEIALKVASYLTVILPLVILSVKVVCRFQTNIVLTGKKVLVIEPPKASKSTATTPAATKTKDPAKPTAQDKATSAKDRLLGFLFRGTSGASSTAS